MNKKKKKYEVYSASSKNINLNCGPQFEEGWSPPFISTLYFINPSL